MARAIGIIVFTLGIAKLALSDRFTFWDIVGPLLLLMCGAYVLRDREAGREPSLQRPKSQTASSARLSPYSPLTPNTERVNTSREIGSAPNVYDTNIYCHTTWSAASTSGADYARSSCDASDNSSSASTDAGCSSYSND